MSSDVFSLAENVQTVQHRMKFVSKMKAAASQDQNRAPECVLFPSCGNSVAMMISSAYTKGVLSAETKSRGVEPFYTSFT